MQTKPKCPKLSPVSENDSSQVFPLTEEEYKKGIATLKNKKAAGIDDVLVEQLKNLGPRAHSEELHTYILLYHMYKLCEHLILDRIAPSIDRHLRRLNTLEVMLQSTLEPDSTHRGWLPEMHDYWCSICWPICSIRHSEP